MDLEFYREIPFKEKGRDQAGCDCWGLGYLFLEREFGVRIQSHDDLYKNTLDRAIPDNFQSHAAEDWIDLYPNISQTEMMSVSPRVERCGDFVLCRYHGIPWHVAIVIRPGVMMHIETGINATIEKDYLGMKWRQRILGFYRHRDMMAIGP